MGQTNIQTERQANFKMLDRNNINGGTTNRTKPFQRKKKINLYENWSSCSKVTAKYPLKK